MWRRCTSSSTRAELRVLRGFFWLSNGTLLLSLGTEDMWSAKMCLLSSLMFFMSHSMNARLVHTANYTLLRG